MSNPRSGGRILVDQLVVHGTDLVFCVPGESYLPVLDALYDTPQLRLIVCRMEAGAANMACAHGQLTGSPGVCIVTRGPGAAHAAVGVHTAQQGSVPLILLVGQVPRSHRGREAFQEVDIEAMFAPLAKWTATIDEAGADPRVREQGISGGDRRSTRAGRAGPARGRARRADRRAGWGASPDRASDAVPGGGQPRSRHGRPRAAAIDGGRWRWLVAAHGGRSDRLGGIVGGPGRDRVSLPGLRRQRFAVVLRNAWPGHGPAAWLAAYRPPISVLAIGTRLDEPTTGSYSSHPGAPASPASDPRTRGSGGAGPGVRAGAGDQRRQRRVRRGRAHARSPGPAAMGRPGRGRPPATSPPSGPRPTEQDGLDLGAGRGAASPRRYRRKRSSPTARGTTRSGAIATGAFAASRAQVAPVSGAMGYGVPAAIAAKLTHPDRPVLSFNGDGCFLMCGQELATAIRHQVNVVFVVIDNGGYGTIRMHQERHYPGRPYGTDLANPDFVAYARSFGLRGVFGVGYRGTDRRHAVLTSRQTGHR